MGRSICRVIPIVWLLLVSAGPAVAQESLTDLQERLRAGDTVYVTDATGVETKARVANVGPSGLRLTIAGLEREFGAADLRQVYRRGDSLKEGAIIGAIGGGVLGGIAGAALGSLFVNEGRSAVGPFLYFLTLGVGGGTAIGAGVDALIPGRTLVYRQNPRAVTIGPVISSSIRGVRFAVRF